MHVSALRLELRIVDCKTARQKRALLGKMIAQLRRHFNVSAAEVDRLDRPDAAVLLVAAVGWNRRESREPLEHVAEAVAVHPLAEVLAQSFHDL